MKPDIFAVIGGDFRSVVVINQLITSGYTVKVYGFDDDPAISRSAIRAESLADALADSSYVVLPLPCSLQNESSINTPLFSGKIPISDLLAELAGKAVVLGGMLDNVFRATLEAKEIVYADYFKREELTVRNAIPTAEGALEIALRETPHTLHGSNCLIAGYGRIAKVLSKALAGLGAKVTVSARKHSDLAWIDANGYNAIETKKIKDHIHSFDVIFNTVPHKIFDRDTLHFAKRDCLILDLASKPGGIDFDAAQKFGLNVIWALSLPGKNAPLTAGSIITDTIMNIIGELEAEE